MPEISGLTFDDAKDELKLVAANGLCDGDDPRVLARTNEATKMLMDLGIWVGTMATYDVTAVGTTLLLPKELENAIEVEVLGEATVRGQTDVTRGAYDCVNAFTYVDPSTAHDNPLVDEFLQSDPDDPHRERRRYDYPGLQANAVVRVTGAKRYLPMLGGSSHLLIQNVFALKLGILAVENIMKGPGSIADAEGYKKMAVEQLQAEVKKHQLDPRRILKLKADYQSDITTYAEGTLGRTRGRLALELNGFLLKGKAEITYLVNRAVQMLVDNRNQLAISGRISVHGTTTELDYAPVNIAGQDLPWKDFNQIRLMVQSFVTESPDPNSVTVAKEFEKQAFELQRAQLIEATEKARHTTYTNALSTFVDGTHGYMVARLALEMPGGLALTETELSRLVNMAEMRIIERGIYKGCLRTLTATIHGGEVLFPRDVEAVLAADICGNPVDIRSIFFEYQKNGPGHNFCGCQERFVDGGEVWFQQTGSKRRKYNFRGSTTSSVELTAVCKARFVTKENCDELTIKNVEALRLFAQGIQNEKNEKWTEAKEAQSDAIDVMERELREYLGGIQHVQGAITDGYGFSGLGGPL